MIKNMKGSLDDWSRHRPGKESIRVKGRGIDQDSKSIE